MADLYMSDLNYDIELKNGDLVFTSDQGFGETVKARLVSFFKTFLGEWFLDNKKAPSWGMPYFQQILGEKPKADELDNIFRTTIQTTDGIDSVESLSFSLNQRELTVSFSAICTDGSKIEDIIAINVGGS
jgi:hypothetical protein